MNKLINEMIENGLGNLIDSIIDKQLTEDEAYLKDLEDANDIKEHIEEMGISKETKQLINDLEACLMSANSRSCYIAYLLGAKNTFSFLKNT